MNKNCNRCGIEKELNLGNWHRSNQTKDGFQGFCKECRNKDKKEYRLKNREKINKQAREYEKRNKDQRDKYFEEYRKRPEVKERLKKWFRENKEGRREYKNDWAKRKYKEDINYKLNSCFSALMRISFKRYGREDKGYRKSFDMVSYTKEELKQHLESQFDEKMTWNNYGKYWVIDHIIPRTNFRFDSYKDEEFQKCWALENLRPLEKLENLYKGYKT